MSSTILGVSGLQPFLLTVKEAASLLRISSALAYELIAQRRLPHVRLGRRILIPRHGLEMWISEETGQPVPPPTIVISQPMGH
jgi:excisionase family DNA binding protein